jgi:peptidoglycan/LPS O-acetylase OafA/YrhL
MGGHVMWSELVPGAWTRYWYQVSMYYYDALSSYWRLGIEESLKIIMPLWSALPGRQGTGVVVPFFPLASLA